MFSRLQLPPNRLRCHMFLILMDINRWTVVGNETISPTNLDGRVTFDNTLGVHDYNTSVSSPFVRVLSLIGIQHQTVRYKYR